LLINKNLFKQINIQQLTDAKLMDGNNCINVLRLYNLWQVNEFSIL